DVTVNVSPGGTPVAASLTGGILLTLGSAAQRTYTVNDSAAIDDLIVSASLGETVGFAGGLIKAGAGRLVLSGTSDFTGITNINAGELLVTNPSALGSATGGTVIASGGALLLSNNVTVASEPITGVTGTGVGGAGAIRS